MARVLVDFHVVNTTPTLMAEYDAFLKRDEASPQKRRPTTAPAALDQQPGGERKPSVKEIIRSRAPRAGKLKKGIEVQRGRAALTAAPPDPPPRVGRAAEGAAVVVVGAATTRVAPADGTGARRGRRAINQWGSTPCVRMLSPPTTLAFGDRVDLVGGSFRWLKGRAVALARGSIDRPPPATSRR